MGQVGFESIGPAPMAGPNGVTRLVPKEFNHPPLAGYGMAREHVLAFKPGTKLVVVFER